MSIETCENCPTTIDTEADGYSVSITQTKKDGETTETSTYLCVPCANQRTVDEYKKTGRLTTKILQMAVWLDLDTGLIRPALRDLVDAEREVLLSASLGQVIARSCVKDFERLVWFAGLQEFIQASDVKGHSATFTAEGGQKIKVLSYAMCGRWRATIQAENGAFIDVITAEDESECRMGINGINATATEAALLLAETTQAWEGGLITLVPDGEVRILGT
jgi:hypothetical protein